MMEAAVVRRVATLARLDLETVEAEALVEDLLAILEHFEVLQSVDTEGVEPLVHALTDYGTPAPDEAVIAERSRERLLVLTKHGREGFHVVPRILGPVAKDPEPSAES